MISAGGFDSDQSISSRLYIKKRGNYVSPVHTDMENNKKGEQEGQQEGEKMMTGAVIISSSAFRPPHTVAI